MLLKLGFFMSSVLSVEGFLHFIILVSHISDDKRVTNIITALPQLKEEKILVTNFQIALFSVEGGHQSGGQSFHRWHTNYCND
jgi:hypothetical protein